MGQRLASLKNFFGSDIYEGSSDACSESVRIATFVMLDSEETQVFEDAEANGNLPSSEANKTSNAEALDNKQTCSDLYNHNSRFETIYSHPLDAQDGRQCFNGNFSETAPKQDCYPISDKSAEIFEEAAGGQALHRSAKTLSFGKRKSKQHCKDQSQICNHILSSKKKRTNWVLKFNCTKNKASKNTDIPGEGGSSPECVCTGYRRTDEHPVSANTVFNSKSAPHSPILGPSPRVSSPVIDLSRFNPEEFPMEDCDETARLQRAREMEEGVEPPPGYRPFAIQVHPNGITVDSLAALFQAHAGIQAAALTALSQIDFTLLSSQLTPVHTQIDYVHCLVPDLKSITACSYYWGKMDRYEAESLLEGKQDGTFLLRDSAQEEYLFSVSFRKYGRSLHARIEQWNHKFSFDSRDPGVYASKTVCDLIEHYKDPSCCMFFEPMLTIPLHRNFAFPLQHLCRAVITTRTTYDGINKLHLPKILKSYLKEYHYKQRVRIRRLDQEIDSQGNGKSMSYIPLV